LEIIYPPTLNWRWMRQRPQQIMSQLARHGHRVYYCNQYSQPGPINEVEPNLFTVTDHDQFLRQQVPLMESPLVWCSWPRLHDTLDLYAPRLVVFDCIDRFPDWEPYVDQMVARSDVIITTSDRLHAGMVDRHQRVHLIRNGCDYPHFARASGDPFDDPQDLRPYPRPRAGFVGAWAPWIDGPLLDAIARHLPDWSVIVIGPLLGGPTMTAPNIHLLGMKPYERLPQYLQQFDVAIVPFQMDDTTLCADPIKMWEYLASGLPVVATPLPEAEKLSPMVRIGRTPEEFAAAMADAVRERSPALALDRQEIARANSWETRFEQIAQAIPELQLG